VEKPRRKEPFYEQGVEGGLLIENPAVLRGAVDKQNKKRGVSREKRGRNEKEKEPGRGTLFYLGGALSGRNPYLSRGGFGRPRQRKSTGLEESPTGCGVGSDTKKK